MEREIFLSINVTGKKGPDMANEQNKKTIRKKIGGKTFLPFVKKEIIHLLTSEEAKISSKTIVGGAISIMALGIAVDASASHWNTHDSMTPHVSYGPHYNYDAGHTNFGAQHASSWPHVSSNPHVSGTAMHTNTHASVNEAVTKGTLHNNAADGYGKHTASLAHNNNPNTHNNADTHVNNAHYSTNGHASTAEPHANFGHHGSAAPHLSFAPHHNAHNSHGSHYSHGQW